MAENRVLDRRMREILHLIREEDPDANIPEDSLSVKWDHELLEQFELLIPGLELQSKSTIDTQPLYKIPQDERQSVEFYDDAENFLEHYDSEYLAEGWHIPEAEFESFKTEIDDREEELEPWDSLTNRKHETIRRQKASVPYITTEGNFIANLTALEVLQREGIETWAWYSPKQSEKNHWGIYIRVDAPEFIAREMFGDLEARQHAWWLATSIILHHEYFHFLSHYHCDRISTTRPRELRYAGYDSHWVKNPTKVIEEAAANGYAYSKLPQNEEIRSMARDFFDWMPEPYNRYLDFLPPFGPRAVAFQHAVRADLQSYTMTEINHTLESIFAPTPSFPVPVYFVNKAPKGYYGIKPLQFQSIHIGPSVRKRLLRGHVPPQVWKKLEATIHALRGNSVEHIKHLHVMNSKSHFVQKNLPQSWRAIWTQVKENFGWTIVFLGSQDEYEHYERVKNL